MWLVYVSSHRMMPIYSIVRIQLQGFIQAILMSFRRHKKTRPSFILKRFCVEILFKTHLFTRYLLKLLMSPSNGKKPKSFRSFTPWTPYKVPLLIRCGAYSALRPLPAFYNFENSILVKKNTHTHTLVELLG